MEMQLLNSVTICSTKLFPAFVDAAVSTSRSLPSTENGEGHGPRREFFECVGQGMGATTSSDKVQTSSSQCKPHICASNASVLITSCDLINMLLFTTTRKGFFYVFLLMHICILYQKILSAFDKVFSMLICVRKQTCRQHTSAELC